MSNIARLPKTLNFYIGKTYLINLFGLIIILMSIVFLFDVVELIRRASKRDDVPLSLVLQMGILKLPEILQILFPFAVLFSGFYTFWQLTRRYELIVIRSAGFSIWQLLTPILFVVIAFGFLQMLVINPLGAALLGKFNQLETRYLTREDQQIALFKEGLWLKQPVQNQTNIENAEYIIIHARKTDQKEWVMHDVNFFFFTNDNLFLARIDAASAKLQKGFWDLSDIAFYKENAGSEKKERQRIPTQLTAQDIEDSFASPETMSFWNLPSHIQTLEKAGFDASKLKIHLYSMLAQPILFVALIFLAAAICIRPPREGQTTAMVGIGIAIGFIVFFMNNFLLTLGASGQIPILLAAWAPASICFLLGLTLIINLEEN